MPNKIYARTFNTVGVFEVAPAVSGRIYNVVAFSIFNNEPDPTDAAIVRITQAVTDFYGGSSGAIYLNARGDHFFLPFRVADPYFSTAANKTLYVISQLSKRVGGILYYTITDE